MWMVLLGLLLATQPLLVAAPAAASVENPGSCCGCSTGCADVCADECGASPDRTPHEEKAPAPAQRDAKRSLHAPAAQVCEDSLAPLVSSRSDADCGLDLPPPQPPFYLLKASLLI